MRSVLRRLGLILIMLIAGWIPLQSVAAWQSMTHAELNAYPAENQAVASMEAAAPMMASACHEMMQSDTTVKQPTHPMSHDMSSHDSHCASCIPLCSGVPPAVSPWSELAAEQHHPVPAVTVLYSDFIPGVLSPPPLSHIV